MRIRRFSWRTCPCSWSRFLRFGGGGSVVTGVLWQGLQIPSYYQRCCFPSWNIKPWLNVTQSSPIATIFSSPFELAVHKINVKLLSRHFHTEVKEPNICSDPALMNKYEITESLGDTLYIIFSKILGNSILNCKTSEMNGS